MATMDSLNKDRSYLYDSRHILPFLADLFELTFVDFFNRARRPHVIGFARSVRAHAFEARDTFPAVSLAALVAEIAGDKLISVALPPPNYLAKAGLGGPPPYFQLGSLVGALQPKKVFEIGTFRGVSALTIALNTADDCEIITLDLPEETSPDEVSDLPAGDKEWVRIVRDSVGIAFREHPLGSKVTQLRANSMLFDAKASIGDADFVLVDGGHSYECIRKDTENALAILNKGGMIVWDDYTWFMDGVCRYLRELSQTLPLRRIESSQYIVYIKP